MCRYSLMRLSHTAILALILLSPGAWAGTTSSDKLSPLDGVAAIVEALKTLSKVPSGQSLLERAMARWSATTLEELTHVFRWGDVSRTDAVLTRHYNPETGTESRERVVSIYLRKNQNFTDLVLDIAHEMTHATGDQNWDPYDPSLTAGKYIRLSIEGFGGEVDAVISECEIGMELARKTALTGVSIDRCRRYLKEGGNRGIDREKVRQDFYRVGKWKQGLHERLGPESRDFPLISTEAPSLYSSTGRAPYPVALLREFEQITQAACENTRNRLDTSARKASRSPASDSTSEQPAQIFLKSRCRAYPLQSL
jgi:hypothetical protein